MARFRVGLVGCVLLELFVSASGWAQSSPGRSGASQLSRLVHSAGIIFSGRVLRIEHLANGSGTPALVQVTFQVERALRGCNAGDTIQIAEWAELWARGDRYRVGQSLVLLLYPRNAAGLTSPVAGELGTFVLGPEGLLCLTPQQTRLLSQSGGRSVGNSLDEPSAGQRNSRPVIQRSREAGQ